MNLQTFLCLVWLTKKKKIIMAVGWGPPKSRNTVGPIGIAPLNHRPRRYCLEHILTNIDIFNCFFTHPSGFKGGGTSGKKRGSMSTSLALMLIKYISGCGLRRRASSYLSWAVKALSMYTRIHF